MSDQGFNNSVQMRGGAPRAGRRRRLLLLVGAVAALLVTAGVVAALTREPETTAADVAGVGCSPSEELGYHIHVHLDIVANGTWVQVPVGVGFDDNCLSWLHTHDSSGVIHIEAPSEQTFTLGQFFQVWGERLDETHLLDHTVDSDNPLVAYVNGQPFDGPPQDIPLEQHAVIMLQYGFPQKPAPTTYPFPDDA